MPDVSSLVIFVAERCSCTLWYCNCYRHLLTWLNNKAWHAAHQSKYVPHPVKPSFKAHLNHMGHHHPTNPQLLSIEEASNKKTQRVKATKWTVRGRTWGSPPCLSRTLSKTLLIGLSGITSVSNENSGSLLSNDVNGYEIWTQKVWYMPGNMMVIKCYSDLTITKMNLHWYALYAIFSSISA